MINDNRWKNPVGVSETESSNFVAFEKNRKHKLRKVDWV